MNFFQKIGSVIAKPKEFFTLVEKEQFMSPFWYYLIFAIVTSLVGIPFYLKSYQLSASWAPLMFIGILILGMVSMFLSSAVVHLGTRIYKAKGSFTNTFKSTVYGATPAFLWSILTTGILGFFSYSVMTIMSMIILPFSLAAYIYTIYLTVIGIKQYHKINTGAAVLATLLPVIIATILGIIIVVIVVIGVIAIGATTLGGGFQ